MNCFETIFTEMMDIPKHQHHLSTLGLSPYELFAISQGPNQSIFNSLFHHTEDLFLRWRLHHLQEYKSFSKGTVHHWSNYLNSDPQLKSISALISDSLRN